MLAIIGGTRSDPPVDAAGRAPRGRPHALWRPVVRAAVRADRRPRRRLPGPARAWPHHTAAPRQLPREPVGAEAARGDGRHRRGVGRRHHGEPPGRPRAAALAHRLHVRAGVDVLRRRRPEGRPRRLHASLCAGIARAVASRRQRAAGIALARRRRLRRRQRPAAGDGRRDRPDGARRRDAGRHDRHARSGPGARTRACLTRRSASSSTTPQAAATARQGSRWTASTRVLEAAMDKVRTLLDHVAPRVPADGGAQR